MPSFSVPLSLPRASVRASAVPSRNSSFSSGTLGDAKRTKETTASWDPECSRSVTFSSLKGAEFHLLKSPLSLHRSKNLSVPRDRSTWFLFRARWRKRSCEQRFPEVCLLQEQELPPEYLSCCYHLSIFLPQGFFFSFVDRPTAAAGRRRRRSTVDDKGERGFYYDRFVEFLLRTLVIPQFSYDPNPSLGSAPSSSSSSTTTGLGSLLRQQNSVHKRLETRQFLATSATPPSSANGGSGLHLLNWNPLSSLTSAAAAAASSSVTATTMTYTQTCNTVSKGKGKLSVAAAAACKDCKQLSESCGGPPEGCCLIRMHQFSFSPLSKIGHLRITVADPIILI